MSRILFAALILAGMSAPAWSQTRGERVGTGSPRYSGHLFLAATLRGGPELSFGGDATCLVRKSSGRTECRSMREWRRLAEKMKESSPVVRPPTPEVTMLRWRSTKSNTEGASTR